jgi:hypothetical protein
MTHSTASVYPFGEEIRETNVEETRDHRTEFPQRSVYERVNEIFGYNVFEQMLMAEGAREMAEESLEISEGNLAVGFETWPPE